MGLVDRTKLKEPAGVLENYADLLRKMNREEEAALLETRAMEIRNRVGS